MMFIDETSDRTELEDAAALANIVPNPAMSDEDLLGEICDWIIAGDECGDS